METVLAGSTVFAVLREASLEEAFPWKFISREIAEAWGMTLQSPASRLQGRDLCDASIEDLRDANDWHPRFSVEETVLKVGERVKLDFPRY